MWRGWSVAAGTACAGGCDSRLCPAAFPSRADVTTRCPLRPRCCRYRRRRWSSSSARRNTQRSDGMKNSPPQTPPSWRHQLASVCIGIAAGFTAGWLLTAAFSVPTAPWPDIPRLEEAVPIKTAATDLESRPVDLLPAEPGPQPEIVSQQPEIVPASPPAPATVAEIVPLPPTRPASVPLPRPRPASERRQARIEPRSFFDYFRVR